MAIQWDFQTSGNWRLIYYQQLIGDERARRVRGAPMIEPIELSYTVSTRVVAVSAVYVEARPTWNLAGYLYQEIGNLNFDDSSVWGGLGGRPAVADSAKRRITLNSTELHIFPKLATEHRYRFEAAYWIPRLTLGLWEYIGAEQDTIEDLVNAARVDLARIETRVNSL